jgi:hypothetical protein
MMNKEDLYFTIRKYNKELKACEQWELSKKCKLEAKIEAYEEVLEGR